MRINIHSLLFVYYYLCTKHTHNNKTKTYQKIKIKLDCDRRLCEQWTVPQVQKRVTFDQDLHVKMDSHDFPFFASVVMSTSTCFECTYVLMSSEMEIEYEIWICRNSNIKRGSKVLRSAWWHWWHIHTHRWTHIENMVKRRWFKIHAQVNK